MSETHEKAERHDAGAPVNGARTAPAAPAGAPDARPLVVRFSNPEEFLAELRERGPNLEPVVRITFRWTRDESGAPLIHLTLLANYLRWLGQLGDDPARAVVSVVHLGRYVGAVWEEGRDEVSDRCRAEADRLRTELAQAAQALGFQVGGGTYCTGRER